MLDGLALQAEDEVEEGMDYLHNIIPDGLESLSARVLCQ